MSEKTNLTPFIGPIMALLRSRKFLVSVVTLVIDLIIACAPELDAIRAELMTAFTFVGSLLVAAIAYEDGQAKANDKQH